MKIERKKELERLKCVRSFDYVLKPKNESSKLTQDYGQLGLNIR